MGILPLHGLPWPLQLRQPWLVVVERADGRLCCRWYNVTIIGGREPSYFRRHTTVKVIVYKSCGGIFFGNSLGISWLLTLLKSADFLHSNSQLIAKSCLNMEGIDFFCQENFDLIRGLKAKQNQAQEARGWRSLVLKKSPPQDFIRKDFDKRHKRQTYISTRSTLMPQGSVASSRAA